MRYLNSFFDTKAFFADKKLTAVAAPTSWLAKDGQTVLGTTIKVEIDQDGTDYGKEGATNEGEQFTVKSAKPIAEYGWIKRHQPVKLATVTQAIVYGDFNNGLSLRGDLVPVKE